MAISFTSTAAFAACFASPAAVNVRDSSGFLPGVEKPSCSGRSRLPALTSRERLRWRPRRAVRVHYQPKRPTRIHERLVKILPLPHEGVDSACKVGLEFASSQLGVPQHSSSAVASGSISPPASGGDDDQDGSSTITNSRAQSRQELVEQWKKLYEENDFLFADESWGALQQEQQEGEGEEEEEVEKGKHVAVSEWVQEVWSMAIVAGRAQNASKVLVWGGSLAFAQQLCQVVSPGAVVVAAHLSLSVLGAIKEMDDAVQCWYGDVLDLSPSYGPFNTVFLNSLVVSAESLDHLLEGVATLCSAGARIVICHAGREEDLQPSRVKDHHLALCGLPDVVHLQSMINSLPLNLIDLQQDRPAVYLATLEVAKTGGQSHSPNDAGGTSDISSMPMQQTQLDLVPV